MSEELEDAIERGWKAYCATPIARDMGRSKVAAAIRAALAPAESGEGAIVFSDSAEEIEARLEAYGRLQSQIADFADWLDSLCELGSDGEPNHKKWGPAQVASNAVRQMYKAARLGSGTQGEG